MTCRLCGGGKLKLFYAQGSEGQFRFYRCRDCQLVNLDLSQPALDQEKYGRSDEGHSRVPARKSRMQERSWRFIRSHLPAGEAGSVLDVGCGEGALLRLAAEDGWKTTGLELLPELAERTSEDLGIRVIRSDFQEYEPDADERYDLIVLRHALEHMPDGRGAMARCASMLSPTGRIYLEVPNIDGISFRLKRLSERLGLRKPKSGESYVPGHCNEYCRKSLHYLAGTAGLRVQHWSTYSSKQWLDPLYRVFPVATKARALLSLHGS